MTAYNPIDTMHRLETSGFKRTQAEALASELHAATTQLVTKAELDKALDAQANKLTLRIGALVGALLAVAVTATNLLH